MKTIIFYLFFLAQPINATIVNDKPDDILDVDNVINSLKKDIRYFSKRNFLGEEVSGYLAPKCFLQDQAAKALKKVQQDLSELNLELIIYDCYRPQMAVNHFVRWAKDPKATEMKSIFYPEVKKNKLFSSGYIASRSGHSKGNTIDLGIVVKNADINAIKLLPLRDCRGQLNQKEREVGMIEMGTHYDCFDSLSHTKNENIIVEAKENRKTLVGIMEKHGFKNYSKEWWHFSFYKNKYPKTFHNFPVE